jgi:hypothetical protein
MKDFFDKDNDTSLPENLEWENMEQGILDKMKNLEKTEAKPKGLLYFRKRYGLALLILLFIGSGLTFSYLLLKDGSKTKNQPNPELNTTKPINSKSQEKKFPMQNQPAGLNQDEDDPANAITKSIQSQSAPRNLREKTGVTRGSKTSSPNPGLKIQPAKKPSLLNAESDKPLLPAVVGQTTAGSDSASSALNTSSIFPSMEINEVDTLMAHDESLPKLVGSSSNSDSSLESSGSLAVSDTLAENSNSAVETALAQKTSREDGNKIPNQLLLEGGLVLWDFGPGQSMPERERYERPQFSYQIQGHFQQSLKRGYFLMAGLQYQQLESKFDYSENISDYVITLRDTVIQVRNNLATGQQERVYGDVEQTVEAEREVVHYNTSRLLKLSLGAGKSWQTRTLKADIYLGTTVNAMAFNQGRSLMENEIIDYNGGASVGIDNRLHLAVFTGARLHYFLEPRLALTGGIQIQQSLMNWSTQENTRFYPLSVGLQVGVSYNFLPLHQ